MHSLHKSSKILLQQANFRVGEGIIAAENCINKAKLWSDLPMLQHIVSRAEAFINEENDRSTSYKDVCSAQVDKWLCVITSQESEKIECGPIPIFWCVNKITWNENVLHFSCGMFEQNGYPCRHIMCVLSLEVPNFDENGAEDVAITWWSIFLVHGDSPHSENKLLSRVQSSLQTNDTNSGTVLGDSIQLDATRMAETAMPEFSREDQMDQSRR
jgi:hypothetical protein